MEEWTGNILSNEGAVLACGAVKVHVTRHTPPGINIQQMPQGARRRWKRAWVIAVYRDDPFCLMNRPLLELITFDSMPDEARREAETIGEWADAYYGA